MLITLEMVLIQYLECYISAIIIIITSEVNNSAINQDTDGIGFTTETRTIGHIVISYTQDLCNSIKKICGKYGIQTHFKK